MSGRIGESHEGLNYLQVYLRLLFLPAGFACRVSDASQAPSARLREVTVSELAVDGGVLGAHYGFFAKSVEAGSERICAVGRHHPSQARRNLWPYYLHR